MKEIGIVRHIDALGRIILLKEICRTLRIPSLATLTYFRKGS